MNKLLLIITALTFVACTGPDFWYLNNDSGRHSGEYEEIRFVNGELSYYTFSDHPNKEILFGQGEIKEAKMIGDTIFVYHYFCIQPEGEDTCYLQKGLDRVYLKKGNKLANVFRFDLAHLFYNFEGDTTSTFKRPIDGIQAFPVNWEGWTGDTAYVDWGTSGYYYRKGKNKKLWDILYAYEEEGYPVTWFVNHDFHIQGDSLDWDTFDSDYFERIEEEIQDEKKLERP